MGLTDDAKRFSEDMVASFGARIDAVGMIVQDTRDTLNGFQAERRQRADQQSQALSDFSDDLMTSVARMLKGFRARHKEMSAAQAGTLGDFMAGLTQGVGGLIKGFQKERAETGAALRASLKSYAGDIETEAKTRLRDFAAAHAEMSGELKDDLAKTVAEIVKGTRELLAGFRNEREPRRARGPVEVKAAHSVRTVKAAVAKPKKQKRGNKSAPRG